MATDEIVENDYRDDIRTIPPWKSHVYPEIPIPDSKHKQAKRIKMDKKAVNLQRFTGLPMPMTTRLKEKKAELSIVTIVNVDSLKHQFSFDHPMKEFVQFHYQFFFQRYIKITKFN